MPRTPRVEDGDGDELRRLVGCDDHTWATSKSEKKAPSKVNNMKKQTSTSHTPTSVHKHTVFWYLFVMQPHACSQYPRNGSSCQSYRALWHGLPKSVLMGSMTFLIGQNWDWGFCGFEAAGEWRGSEVWDVRRTEFYLGTPNTV